MNFSSKWFSIFIFTIIITMVSFSAIADLKVGFIRSEYIFSKFKPYTDAQKQMEDYSKKELDKVDKMQADLQKKAQDAKNQEMLMTDEMKTQKLNELQKQQAEIEKYYEDLYRKDGVFEKKQAELLQPIIDQINTVLMRISKNENYDYVFDAGNGGPLLYANPTYDISEKILTELGKEISTK